MYWDTGIGQALGNTLLVCLGASLFATIAGTILAFLVGWYRIPGRHVFASIAVSMVLIPTYVQAMAWIAGFGNEGWFRISQVAAAISSARAIASVVWIHGASAVGLCFLIVLLGLSRACDDQCELAIREFGPGDALRRIVMRKTIPWILGAMGCVFCMTNNDMVVTNLFQVPTLTESVYQQVQFQQLRSAPIALTFAFSIAIGCLVGTLVFRYRNTLAREDAAASPRWIVYSQWTRWGGFGVACVLSIALIGLPWLNLIYKAGAHATEIAGRVEHRWGGLRFVDAIAQSSSYRSELFWSLSLSGYASAMSLGIALLLVPMRRWPIAIAVLCGGMTFAISLPGPLVNLAIGWLMNGSNASWMTFLADRTLVAPILALQFRTLPIAFLILWIASRRFEAKAGVAWTLDCSLSLGTRAKVWFRFLVRPLVMAITIPFFIAFADLSTYLLVNPVQVRTVAMMMFEQLHYGVRNQESAFAILLAMLSAVPGIALLQRLVPQTS